MFKLTVDIFVFGYNNKTVESMRFENLSIHGMDEPVEPWYYLGN